jgi:hypothetical protein
MNGYRDAVQGARCRPGWGPGQAAQRRKRQENRLAKPQIDRAWYNTNPPPNIPVAFKKTRCNARCWV